MRIAIFSESYEPIVNGVSVCVATLRDGLTQRGHEVHVFAPQFKGHSDRWPNVHRFPSAHTVLMRDYPFPVPFTPDLRRRFSQLRFDIAHTQTPFLLGLAGARWARRFGVPLVSTNHTLYTEYSHYVPVRPQLVTRWTLVRLMRWYYSGCDAVVAPSSAVENVLRSYGVKKPIQVIRTGVVAPRPLQENEVAEVRRAHGVDKDGFLLLYVGRVAREKNLGMLLEAFSMVVKAHPEARLLLVGGGPALAETQQAASALGIAVNISFLGMMNREQIDPLYASADAFAFPSTTETQGLAICEALGAGLPVVAVDAGGIPENVRDGVDGFLTRDDPVEFAERISFLISNPQKRREMAAQARGRADSFSVDRMVEDFERFYQSVIDGADPSDPGCPDR